MNTIIQNAIESGQLTPKLLSAIVSSLSATCEKQDIDIRIDDLDANRNAIAQALQYTSWLNFVDKYNQARFSTVLVNLYGLSDSYVSAIYLGLSNRDSMTADMEHAAHNIGAQQSLSPVFGLDTKFAENKKSKLKADAATITYYSKSREALEGLAMGINLVNDSNIEAGKVRYRTSRGGYHDDEIEYPDYSWVLSVFDRDGDEDEIRIIE